MIHLLVYLAVVTFGIFLHRRARTFTQSAMAFITIYVGVFGLLISVVLLFIGAC